MLISPALSDECFFELQFEDGEGVLEGITFFHAKVKPKALIMGILTEVDLPPCCETLKHHAALPVRSIPIDQYSLPLLMEAVRLQDSEGQFDSDCI